MAEPDETKSSPFDFSKVPGNDTFGVLKKQWDSFLEEPGAQTALLQFGINMMQPPSFGDTAFSQMGRAIGGAGEAIGRREEMGRKEFEAETKANLAEARARAAEAAAGRTQDRSFYEQQKLDLARDAEQRKREVGQLQGTVKANVEYNRYVRDILDKNEAREQEWNNPVAAATRPKGAIKPDPIRIMPPEEFYASPLGQHLMQGIGLQPKGAPATAPAPGKPAAKPDLTGRGGPTDSVIEVKTPEEARALPPGQRYKTPDGRTFTR